ncbi:acyl-CoA dehydrogenase family protein [Granulosicoccus antarcticus]|uniref:Acyl-CoA dehydrogenase n=1 Tax=Granulosicoccus antarcticus IMCC3135 TaxID=1192854 RepID=A0A2Z2NT23_9GAMM|nr:acyl-CoA dehydrogenase family protein [Granulosicoccus antarcticus]ASJ72888.1 Acyl-CoA dehydrogenase [Granulosicoccus antarcticus IMCC3135]
MNFELTEEQRAIQDMALAFGEAEIAPHAARWEQEGSIPKELLRQVGELGFAGIYVSEEFGGSNLSRLDATLIFEALSKACPSVAAFISIHNMCAWMIDRYGSDEMRARLLPSLCSYEKVASYCLTEPGSGSDAAALRTRAEKVGDNLSLNGSKAFISGGGYADLYLVMCRTGGEGPSGISAVLVEDGTPGLSFGAPERKMGWRSQPTAEVQFADCQVPASNLLGKEGDGFRYAMSGLDGGRLNISACSLGAAQNAMDKSVVYASERKAFGAPINQLQSLQFKLADMEISLQASRSLLHKAAWKLDQKAPDAAKFCAMAKRFVTDQCFDVANDALQIHGGYGYLEDYGIEKIVRDIRVHQILEGTNEIMRLVTARALMSEYT